MLTRIRTWKKSRYVASQQDCKTKMRKMMQISGEEKGKWKETNPQRDYAILKSMGMCSKGIALKEVVL